MNSWFSYDDSEILHFFGDLVEHIYACVDYYWDDEEVPESYILFDLPLKSLVVVYEFLHS